jgi:hypothetical protein
MAKSYMPVGFRDVEDRVKIHQILLEKFRRPLHNRVCVARPGVDLAAGKSYIDLRPGVANDELRLLETKPIGEQTPEGSRAQGQILT